MVNISKKFYNRFISFLLRRKDFINKIFIEIIFKRKFIPDIISNRKYFSDWEKAGFHITENHFYNPVPDMSKIAESYWNRVSALGGIQQNIPTQINFLEEIKKKYSEIYNQFPINKEEVQSPWEYYIQNNNFTSVDGEILYSIIRKYQPAKIIEIGSGYSSFLISKAVTDIQNYNGTKPQFISIEPYPRDFFKTSIPGLDSVIEKPVQDADIELFKSLSENDILFIDSTHVLKYNSDVEFEIFEILPLLKKGVIIHFHDIFFPGNYPKKWIVENGWFWNEQQFLQAFLMYNESYEILWSSSIMHHQKPELLIDAFNSYTIKEHPGSLWISKIK
ncbi:class I SAM-dependent methyltransferase [soil metagenome]